MKAVKTGNGNFYKGIINIHVEMCYDVRGIVKNAIFQNIPGNYRGDKYEIPKALL